MNPDRTAPEVEQMPDASVTADVDLSNDAAPALPAVLTVDEVASLLRVNRKTIYEMIARHELPGVRSIGRSFRIDRDAVLSWLRDGQGRGSRNARKAMR